MALTVTRLHGEPAGSLMQIFYQMQLDNLYPTGGEPYSVSDFKGPSSIAFLTIVEVNAGGRIIEHDRTNKKFIVKFFDYDAVADGAAIEVPNNSDQSAVRFTVMVRGRMG